MDLVLLCFGEESSEKLGKSFGAYIYVGSQRHPKNSLATAVASRRHDSVTDCAHSSPIPCSCGIMHVLHDTSAMCPKTSQHAARVIGPLLLGTCCRRSLPPGDVGATEGVKGASVWHSICPLSAVYYSKNRCRSLKVSEFQISSTIWYSSQL